MINTRLHYLYRDTHGNTTCGDIVFAGTDTAARYADLLVSLPDDEAGYRLFVPEQIGLPSLRHDLPGDSHGNTNWHEFTGAEPTSGPPSRSETFSGLIDRCLMVGRWDPDPRIAHGTVIYDSGLQHDTSPGPDDADVPAADCWIPAGMAGGGADAWIAVTRGTGGGVPVPPARPIGDIPATGQLAYRARVHPGSPKLRYVWLPTPGQIVITADQIYRWTGCTLNEFELRELARLIPGSSIPGAIGAITRTLPRHRRPGRHGIHRRLLALIPHPHR